MALCGGSEENYLLLLEGRLDQQPLERCGVCEHFKLKALACQSCQESPGVQVKVQIQPAEEAKEEALQVRIDVDPASEVERENKLLKLKLQALQQESST